MRRLMIALLSCLLVLPVTVATASAAHACSCAPPEREASLSGADLIARVTVTGEEEVDHERVYHLRVDREWKGPGHSSARLSTGLDTPSCGLSLAEGEEYLLFAQEKAGGGWQSSWCTATSRVGASGQVVTLAEIEQRYGDGRVPVPPHDDVVSAAGPDLALWGILAVVLLILALTGGAIGVAARSRRSR